MTAYEMGISDWSSDGCSSDLFDERHAQGCRFRDHAAYVNKRYRQIVHALHAPPTDDPDRAARYFGHLLHGLQDFYSHSNWIPRPPEGLGLRNRILDSGLGDRKSTRLNSSH